MVSKFESGNYGCSWNNPDTLPGLSDMLAVPYYTVGTKRF